MALADYKLCDLCERKAFYDAQLGYDFKSYPGTGLWNCGDWKVLCSSCAETHEVVIRSKTTVPSSEASLQPTGARFDH